LDEGLDTACIELCTDMGDCKSLLLIVESRFAPPFPLPQANDDRDTIPEGDRLIFNVSLNDTFDVSTDTLKLIESSQWGMLAEIGDGIFGYQGEDGFCGNDSFRYAICNPTGCDTATVQLNILCDELRVYSGFSPNGDGVNDAFRIDGLTLYPNNVLRVFNRWGNLVFEQQGYTNDWEGRWKGEELPDGTYFYVLELNNENQRRETGYVILHR
ncbi:MAG: gliding motility-associated C-terminal domain-containing protein, partial [Bacteroidota bacterium]